MPPRKKRPAPPRKKAPVPVSAPRATAAPRREASRAGRAVERAARAPAAPPPKRTVVILSRKRSLYSTSRLVEAVKARGHRPLVLDTLRCTMILARGAPRMLYRGVEVRGVDVVLPRIGASITGYGLAVVNHFDMMGVPVLNNSVPIARSRDKLRCLQLLARFGIDIPRTVMAHDRSNVARLVGEVGGLPVIIKLLKGTQGVGVMIANTLPEVQTIVDTFLDLGQEIVLQEFIAESRGKDVRALVVGDKVVGAMRRTAKGGEFRSNIHRGGEGTALALSAEYVRTAVEAARIVGLEVAGVDMLEGKEGPKVMEINSSPGFEGLEAATGGDVAGAIIDHALAFATAHAAGWSKRRLI